MNSSLKTLNPVFLIDQTENNYRKLKVKRLQLEKSAQL
jgi:hypothetical protein